MKMLFLPLLVLLLLEGVVCGDVIIITSADDFIEFSNSVNSRTNYSGTTVFLDADIDFSGGTFEPVGNSDSRYFLGTFDGQGHTISNIKIIPSSMYYVGLFGYSYGATIKNVVMDSSCSVTNYHERSFLIFEEPAYAGGIIGQCYSTSNPCILENNVNMASVTFDGTFDEGYLGIYPSIGGIVGSTSSSSSSYASYVRNCVNYGSVTVAMPGSSTDNTEVGGIVGYISGSSSNYATIQNSLNYGAIVFNGTDKSEFYVGGIVGESSYTILENCVSVGKINPTSLPGNAYIGSVAGSSSSTNITHCIWTSDVGYTEPNGTETLAITNSSLTVLNITTMSELNVYAELNEEDSAWSKWFMLHLNGGSISSLSYEALAGLEKSLPDPAKEGHSFLFWCTDASCNGQYTPETAGTGSTVTDLYALWMGNYTVTFDFSNGTVQSAVFPFNSTVQYPTAIGEREGYDFGGWDRNVTLMPAENITIRAVWNISNPSEYVEIVFTNVDLSEEDVKEIIQGYTNEKFTIEKFEVDKKTGELTVIIKFADEEKASEFIRSVDENKESGNAIKYVRSLSDYKDSFSSIIYPSLLSFLL